MQLSSPVACNLQTVEEAPRPGAPGFIVYSVSKALADLAVRDFKRAHLDLDLTTIHPSYIYGPVGSGQVYNSPRTGTNRLVYDLIVGAPGRPVNGYDPQAATLGPPPPSVDVRDVARALVIALKVPPSDTLKRFIPQLRPPVITGKEVTYPPFFTFHTSATEAILGLKSCIKWQDTVLDTIDDLLRVEKELATAAQ